MERKGRLEGEKKPGPGGWGSRRCCPISGLFTGPWDSEQGPLSACSSVKGSHTNARLNKSRRESTDWVHQRLAQLGDMHRRT